MGFRAMTPSAPLLPRLGASTAWGALPDCRVTAKAAGAPSEAIYGGAP